MLALVACAAMLAPVLAQSAPQAAAAVWYDAVLGRRRSRPPAPAPPPPSSRTGRWCTEEPTVSPTSKKKTPLSPDSVFRLGSVTKQFTSMAIMMLVEQGKVGLQDPIDKYLPGYPMQGKVVTVEHLLTHTSGIQSYTDIPGTWPARCRPT